MNSNFSEKKMRDIYNDGKYLDSNPSWHMEDSVWKASNILKILKNNKLKPSSVVEVGCGAGEVLRNLAVKMSDIKCLDGYDISEDAYSLAKTKETEKIKFYNKDLMEADSKKYELLMAIDVFEHIEDNFTFLRNMGTKAEYKIFHIPLDLSVQSLLRMKPILETRKSVGHIHYYTKELALALLEDTGYEILDYFYTSGSLELPNRGWKANLLKFPRKILFALSPDLAARILGGFSLMVLAK